MIFCDAPQTDRFPADRLSDLERLNRLFAGVSDKWRLLTVLCDFNGACGLLLPELSAVVSRYAEAGLLSRLVFLGVSDIRRIESQADRWTELNTRISGMDIHASRIAGEQPLPLVNLYDPDGNLVWSINGFDTEKGLDDLADRLEQILLLSES